MYVILDSNNEVMGDWEDQDYADLIAAQDGNTVISVAQFNFREDMGYRYNPSLNTFEEYIAPPPPEDADD